MALTKQQKSEVKEALKTSLRNKFANHNPEPASMPFHTRLLGKDRLALYSFIHSLNTNFGTTIFEPAALAFAKYKFKNAEIHTKAGDSISSEAQAEIQRIIDGISTAAAQPDKQKEIEAIRRVCTKGEMREVRLTAVDISVETQEGEVYMFDLKTAKPNIGGFREFKRTLLEWVAVFLVKNPRAKIQTAIAIPYNPYEPEPYRRWTMRGMLDLEHELKVAQDFWDFLGGRGTYEDLLDCFEQVGIEMRDEIDTYFAQFKTH